MNEKTEQIQATKQAPSLDIPSSEAPISTQITPNSLFETEKNTLLSDEKKIRVVNVDDKFEALLRSCEHCQQWITLADTKAGLILTIHGILSGFLIQYISKIQESFRVMSLFERSFVLSALILYFIFQLISFLFTVKVFFPRQLNIDYKETRHVFPVGLQNTLSEPTDREKFWDEYKKLSEEDLQREFAMQYHTDGLICNQKYLNLRKALKTLFVAGILAFLSFTLIQLMVIPYTIK